MVRCWEGRSILRPAIIHRLQCFKLELMCCSRCAVVASWLTAVCSSFERCLFMCSVKYGGTPSAAFRHRPSVFTVHFINTTHQRPNASQWCPFSPSSSAYMRVAVWLYLQCYVVPPSAQSWGFRRCSRIFAAGGGFRVLHDSTSISARIFTDD